MTQEQRPPRSNVSDLMQRAAYALGHSIDFRTDPMDTFEETLGVLERERAARAARGPTRLGWWVGGSFSAGLVLGLIIGYLLFAVLLVLEAPHHRATHAPAPVPPGSCPLPYPGQIIPPGCPIG